MSVPLRAIQSAHAILQGKCEGHGGTAGVEIQHERLEKHAERENEEWCAEEESDGADTYDQPPVKTRGRLLVIWTPAARR